jgi:hypothetical protein
MLVWRLATTRLLKPGLEVDESHGVNTGEYAFTIGHQCAARQGFAGVHAVLTGADVPDTRVFNERHCIPISAKTPANRAAAGCGRGPNNWAPSRSTTRKKLDNFAATAFTPESPVAVMCRNAKASRCEAGSRSPESAKT